MCVRPVLGKNSERANSNRIFREMVSDAILFNFFLLMHSVEKY